MPAQPAPVAQSMAPVYRPSPITTPEFGGAWGSLPLEKSVQVATAGIKTTDAYK